MDNRVQRSPFLEENVDELIGNEARGDLDVLSGMGSGDRGRRICQCLCRDVGRDASFGEFAIEDI